MSGQSRQASGPRRSAASAEAKHRCRSVAFFASRRSIESGQPRPAGVSRLRRLLGAETIETNPAGYRLRTEGIWFDGDKFEEWSPGRLEAARLSELRLAGQEEDVWLFHFLFVAPSGAVVRSLAETRPVLASSSATVPCLVWGRA